MNKLLRISLVLIVGVVTTVGVIAAPPQRAEAAEAPSTGCQSFKSLGPISAVSVTGIGTWSFYAGETIQVTADALPIVPTAPQSAPALAGSTVSLEVNGAVVDSAFNIPPVTLSYTFPADGDYFWSFYTNLSGGVLWSTDCTTAPPAGCDLGLDLPDWAVVGRFTENTALEWMPGQDTDTVVEVGKTAWVLGVNEEGTHYLIYWGCARVWVPVGSMGPNYDEVWNGTPLPTHVME
jgi:hypothetical protein